MVLVLLSLTFSITSLILKKGYFAFAGSGTWLITSIYMFGQHIDTWDIYFCLGFLFIALALVEAFSPLAWRETTPTNETPEEPDVAEMKAEMEAFNKERSQYNFLYKNKPKRRNRW
jgi:hypothetical protein